MKVKKIHVKIIRDVFFYLLIATILVVICQYFYLLFFPGLQAKLAIITTIFGLVWTYLSFISKREIRLRVKEVKDVKKKLIIFLIGFVFYSLFINWSYSNLSFDEFMFFVLVLYVPLSIILELNPKIPFIIGLFLLSICGLYLTNFIVINNYFPSRGIVEPFIDKIAIYSYYFLFIGIIISIKNSLHL